MGRNKGSRNKDYDARRQGLALAIAAALVDDTGKPRPMKELAQRVSVTVPTLLHYFGDHPGMVRAAFEAVGAQGAAQAAQLDSLGQRPAAEALRRFALNLVDAFRGYGLGRVFSGGLVLALGDPLLGPDFLRQLLEPTLAHAEQLVAALQRRGELEVKEPRLFAVSFVSPLVIALLHQDALGGRQLRLLDVDAFVSAHVALLLRGATPAGAPPRSATARARRKAS
jgi:AcrR family transcriptional regulator